MKTRIAPQFAKSTMVSAFSLILLSACASKEQPCEEILEVKRQHQECEQLRKKMNKKGFPQQTLTARKRYEAECVNLRYVRDDYDTICKKNETPIGERKPD